jgi:hypothetical protein
MRITEVVQREFTCAGQPTSEALVFLDQDHREFTPDEEEIEAFVDWLESQSAMTQAALEFHEMRQRNAEAYFKELNES